MFLQIVPSLATALVLYKIPATRNFVKHVQGNIKKPQYHEDRQFCSRNFLIKYCYSCKALPTGVVRAAGNFSPFPFLATVKTLLLPESHPVHCDWCRAWRWLKIQNRTFVPSFGTGDEERVVLQNSCERHFLLILILVQPAPETKGNDSLVCWTALGATSHWFRWTNWHKTFARMTAFILTYS